MAASTHASAPADVPTDRVASLTHRQILVVFSGLLVHRAGVALTPLAAWLLVRHERAPDVTPEVLGGMPA